MEVSKRKTLLGARYLSFFLNTEEYSIEILRIKEIMSMTAITPIPHTPDFIKGVLNLRGQIIPIIDLRLKFKMPELEYNSRTSIIIVEYVQDGEKSFMGIVVDTIKEVISIPEEKIKKVPYINAKIKSEFIHGIADSGDGIKIIVDITKVLSEDEFVLVKQMDRAGGERSELLCS